MGERITARTGHGRYKLSSDCWRTINGQHYEAWIICPSDKRVALYRQAGIRCRRFADELFVHTLDIEQAKEIDAKEGDDYPAVSSPSKASHG